MMPINFIQEALDLVTEINRTVLYEEPWIVEYVNGVPLVDSVPFASRFPERARQYLEVVESYVQEFKTRLQKGELPERPDFAAFLDILNSILYALWEAVALKNTTGLDFALFELELVMDRIQALYSRKTVEKFLKLRELLETIKRWLS